LVLGFMDRTCALWLGPCCFLGEGWALGFRVEERVSLLHGGLLATHGSLAALGLGEDVSAGERLVDVLAVRGDGDLWEAGREEESEVGVNPARVVDGLGRNGGRAGDGWESRREGHTLAFGDGVLGHFVEGVVLGGKGGRRHVRACGRGEVSSGKSAGGPDTI
jgi:hypothetical protein